MADRDDWTADDDARLRAALTSLRTDVEAAPLPDVRFVKARGTARRRQRMLTWTAAAAVAAVVVGTVGYSELGRDTASVQAPPAGHSGTAPAAPSATPSATTTAADSLDQPGALPILTDWTQALHLTGSVLLTPVKPFGPIECLASEPGVKVQQEQVARIPDVEGGQVRFRIAQGQDPRTAAEDIASDIAGCQLQPAYHVTPETTGDFPRLYSYTAGDAGSGWWAVVPGAHDVVVLQVNQNDRPTSSFTHAQLSKLAELARQRLVRYGTGTSATATSSPPTTSGSGPKALDEKMPVTGPGSVPSWRLFVAASQWRSDGLTGGAKTNAGPGALEGSTAIASCETDEQQSGIGGQVGVVSVRTGAGTTSYIGHQRVQLDEATDPAVQQTYVNARLTEAKALYAKGCPFPNGKVKSTKGPTEGTFRLDTVFSDGSASRSQWVGVTAQKTPGAVSTIVLTHVADPGQGFAELDRLLALARQK